MKLIVLLIVLVLVLILAVGIGAVLTYLFEGGIDL